MANSDLDPEAFHAKYLDPEHHYSQVNKSSLNQNQQILFLSPANPLFFHNIFVMLMRVISPIICQKITSLREW